MTEQPKMKEMWVMCGGRLIKSMFPFNADQPETPPDECRSDRCIECGVARAVSGMECPGASCALWEER